MWTVAAKDSRRMCFFILGLMIAEAARPMGIRTVCLDPAPDAPAGAVCDEHIVGRFVDI